MIRRNPTPHLIHPPPSPFQWEKQPLEGCHSRYLRRLAANREVKLFDTFAATFLLSDDSAFLAWKTTCSFCMNLCADACISCADFKKLDITAVPLT
jgi:hypothetical protein